MPDLGAGGTLRQALWPKQQISYCVWPSAPCLGFTCPQGVPLPSLPNPKAVQDMEHLHYHMEATE